MLSEVLNTNKNQENDYSNVLLCDLATIIIIIANSV